MTGERENVEAHEIDGGLPGLVIPDPYCGHCHADVEMDDGDAYCMGCGVAWTRPYTDGTPQPATDWDDDLDPVELCGRQPAPDPGHPFTHVVDGEGYERGPLRPCNLPKGHPGNDHRHPYTLTTWTVAT